MSVTADGREDNAQNAVREISEEDRKVLADTLSEHMDAISLEDAIANAPRSKPDKSEHPRWWKIGHAAGKMVRQLVFWEGKGEAGDYSIHKVKREWYTSDARLTESELRTGTRILKDEGMLETWSGYRPSDRRQTTYYRLSLWAVTRVAVSSEIDTIKERLEHERRPKHKERLTKRLDLLRRTLSDLELRFLDEEPQEVDGWIETEPAPDMDAPEPEDEAGPYWMDDEFMDQGHTLSTYPCQFDNLPLSNCTPNLDKLPPLQKTTQESTSTRERQVVTPTFSSHKEKVGGATALAGRTPRHEERGKERTKAPTSQPPPEDPIQALIEPGGELHALAQTALDMGRTGTDLLARHVTKKLGGDPMAYVEVLRDALAAMAQEQTGQTTKMEVA